MRTENRGHTLHNTLHNVELRKILKTQWLWSRPHTAHNDISIHRSLLVVAARCVCVCV